MMLPGTRLVDTTVDGTAAVAAVRETDSGNWWG
jgi:hypothetical protein